MKNYTYTLDQLNQMMNKNGPITVNGNLTLFATEITALPDNLTVVGNLDLRYTPITFLPDNLTVGGDLWLKDTPITESSLAHVGREQNHL